MIRLGQLIAAKLLADADVTDLIGDNVYPLHIPDEVDYPTVVFARTGLIIEDTKDFGSDIDEVTIKIADRNYANSEDIAYAVQKSIKSMRGDVSKGIRVEMVTVVDEVEYELDDAYVQELTINVKSTYE